MGILKVSCRVLVVLGSAVLLQACSGSGEDPRVSLCRSLAAEFSGSEADRWSAAGNRFARPEYAEVKVRSDSGETASCFYEFDAAEELGAHGSQQFFDYSSLPYRMTYNDTDIAEKSLKAAVIVQQKAVPAEALRQAREAVEMAKQKIEKAVIEVRSE